MPSGGSDTGRVAAEASGAGPAPSGQVARTAPAILFLHPGPDELDADPTFNMLHHLGKRLVGGAVFASWAMDWGECRLWQERTRLAVGGFDYRPVPSFYGRYEWVRPFRTIWLLYREALRCAQSLPQRVDAVIGYSPYGVGLAAWLVARRLGVPLVIQVQNDMRHAYLGHHGLLNAVKKRVSGTVSRFVLGRARGWHVYFPEQTGAVALRDGQQRFQFTDFTPVSAVPTTHDERPEFLLVGYPWQVKGVDLAIRAFREAGDRLAGWTLRIVGHCPDRAPYERLAGGDPRISFEGAAPHVKVLESIAHCGVYLLPSRTEAYGRVTIEAMAAGRPVIAARVGGVPTYVRDGETGVLVPPEDVTALSEAMVRLAHAPETRARFGARAREVALREYHEERWVEHFEHMVRSVMAERP